jgi:N6-adenosine-specific RNA methylase IME4
MVERSLPFTSSTAQRLIKIARDPRLSNPAHVQLLPNQWGTLYELTKLDNETFEKNLADGSINPDMLRTSAVRINRGYSHKAAAEQNVGRGYGLLLADPPWAPVTWKLPYDTMPIEDIRDLRLGADGRASRLQSDPSVKDVLAPNAAIFVWAIEESLDHVTSILESWGTKRVYPTLIWDKARAFSEGKVGRYRHEYLCVGLRGDAAPVWLPESIISVPRDGLIHSQKPVEFYKIIERMFPSFLQRLELFARREQPGWHGWGNQYPGTNRVKELRHAKAA